MEFSAINMNDHAYVKPNSNTMGAIMHYFDVFVYPGRNADYTKDAEAWYIHHLVKVDGVIYIKAKIHELMNVFGPSSTMGSSPSFVNNQIYFDINELTA